jgi:hypothetical protein
MKTSSEPIKLGTPPENSARPPYHMLFSAAMSLEKSGHELSVHFYPTLPLKPPLISFKAQFRLRYFRLSLYPYRSCS